MSGSFEDAERAQRAAHPGISFAVAAGQGRSRYLARVQGQRPPRDLRRARRVRRRTIARTPPACWRPFDGHRERSSATVPRSPSSTPGYGGAAEALFKMCVGNGIGVALDEDVRADEPVRRRLTAASSWSSPTAPSCPPRLTTCCVERARQNDRGLRVRSRRRDACDLATLQEAWESGIESVFPLPHQGRGREPVDAFGYQSQGRPRLQWRQACVARA